MGRAKRFRRRASKVLLAIGAAVAVIGTPLFCQRADFVFTSRDLGPAAAAYREAGLPWTSAELFPRNESHGPNGAPIAKRLGLLVDVTSNDHAWSDFSSSVSRLDDGELRHAFAPYRSSVTGAAALVESGELDIVREWDDLERDAIDAGQARRGVGAAALLLAAEARTLAAENGGSATALKRVDDIFRLALLSRSHGDYFDVVLSLRIEEIGLRAVETLAAKHPELRSELRRRFSTPATIDVRPSLRVEAYERLVAARTGVLWRETGYAPVLTPRAGSEIRDGLPSDFRDRAIFARCLRDWTEFQAEMRRSSDPVALERASKRIAARNEESIEWSRIFSAVLFPQFSADPFRRQATQWTLARAYLDLLRDPSLEGIADRADGWGHPLILRRMTDGFEITAVGPPGDRQPEWRADHRSIARSDGYGLRYDRREMVVRPGR